MSAERGARKRPRDDHTPAPRTADRPVRVAVPSATSTLSQSALELHGRVMSPRRYTVEPAKGVFAVDWPLFGELSRALALRVARAYDPQVVIGVATAGVVPGAVLAAILDREFHSLIVS